MTGANAIASAAYSNSADVMHISVSIMGTGYLLADFRVTGSFSTAPVAGALQLVKVPRDFSGNIGPTPASTLLPGQVWTFSPLPQASNATKTSIIFSVDAVPLDYDADYWLFNNALGQSLSSGYTFAAQPYSPGT